MNTNIFNIKSITLLLALFAFLFSSCRKEIDLDLRSADPILVIQSEICESEAAIVKLSSTKGYFDKNDFPSIGNAIVSISKENEPFEQLIYVNDSVFLSETTIGEVGKTYTLKVEYGNETYTAISKLLPPVPIDSVKLVPLPFPAMKDLVFTLFITDPPGKEIDYYRFYIYVNGNRILKSRNFVGSADILDGNSVKSTFIVPIENENEQQMLFPGDEIKFEMHTIDKGAYQFFSSLGATGKTNPTTNIEGGALGYFCAYSASQKSVFVEE